jgi:hypothetical protein
MSNRFIITLIAVGCLTLLVLMLHDLRVVVELISYR